MVKPGFHISEHKIQLFILLQKRLQNKNKEIESLMRYCGISNGRISKSFIYICHTYDTNIASISLT
jgi:hypothetical protein